MTRAALRNFGAVLIVGSTLAACGHRQSALPDFADLVEAVSPAVVNISTIAAATQAQPPADGKLPPAAPEEGPPRDWYHKYFDDNEDEAGPDVTVPEQSLGSGFILWADGYVLTNRHVVNDSKEIIVRLSDRRQLPAKLIGMDERSDLALLKVEATNLPTAKLGDVSKLRVGNWALAIGSPFGFDYSATAGIVSAKGRNLSSEQYVPFIQTDVAINPGNSGGPLFNINGEVIGVNSQIFSQSGGYMGVSFAIPIDVAAKVARELKDHGKVTRGWLGVVVQEVDRGLAQSFGMKKPEGALISRIIPGGPAEQAGLKSGDIILSYNGQELANSAALPPMVGSSDPGEKAQLKLMRDGKQIDVPIQVGTLDPGEIESKAEHPAAAPPGTLGVVVRALTADERTRAQIVSGGVWVSEVNAGAGREAGLRNGDIILSLGGSEIDGPERFGEVIGRLQPRQSVPLLVQRRGTPVFLAMEIPGAPDK